MSAFSSYIYNWKYDDQEEEDIGSIEEEKGEDKEEEDIGSLEEEKGEDKEKERAERRGVRFVFGLGEYWVCIGCVLGVGVEYVGVSKHGNHVICLYCFC